MQDLSMVVVAKYNYWVAVILMMIGLYGVIAKNNLVKKVIGLVIFQTSIILFYVSISVKRGGGIPIVDPHALHDAGHHAAHGGHEAAAHAAKAVIEVSNYANPLPHVLMLTAIVVGVGTLGVALAVIERIYKTYGTVEEDAVLDRMLY